MNWEEELEHMHSCAACSEGQTCCLDKRWIRDFIKQVIRDEKKEILDMAVAIHGDLLTEHGYKQCNCFRERFGVWLGVRFDAG